MIKTKKVINQTIGMIYYNPETEVIAITKSYDNKYNITYLEQYHDSGHFLGLRVLTTHWILIGQI